MMFIECPHTKVPLSPWPSHAGNAALRTEVRKAFASTLASSKKVAFWNFPSTSLAENPGDPLEGGPEKGLSEAPGFFYKPKGSKYCINYVGVSGESRCL